MPRFVILEHDHPVLHWDLMLEAAGVLQTWRLAESPSPDRPTAATALGDHRIAYLDYEGPVSGNRGTVRRWDTGTFDELPDSAPNARKLQFDGARVRGAVLLIQIAGNNWQFTWKK